ncbi:SdpI family protein [Sanguibacter sp. YZGR15]|uniref:SdpI family protein n=2 Tax=Sanguibacter suaedae TaxID=2795737 RepID=A0A934MAL9_9MICO|nr:SdpI family protein [Sanguibacter suaedae]
MNDWVFAGLAFAAIGGFLLWTAVHSVRQDVDHRRSPGLRTPTTLESRQAWLAAHRRISPVLWRTGLVTMILSVAAVIWGSVDGGGNAEAFVVGCLLTFLPVLVHVYVRGSRAASEARGDR